MSYFIIVVEKKSNSCDLYYNSNGNEDIPEHSGGCNLSKDVIGDFFWILCQLDFNLTESSVDYKLVIDTDYFNKHQASLECSNLSCKRVDVLLIGLLNKQFIQLKKSLKDQ